MSINSLYRSDTIAPEYGVPHNQDLPPPPPGLGIDNVASSGVIMLGRGDCIHKGRVVLGASCQGTIWRRVINLELRAKKSSILSRKSTALNQICVFPHLNFYLSKSNWALGPGPLQSIML